MMDQSTALSQMVSPGMPRPKIWQNGVLQIWITRACDLSCFGCTQASNLGGKPGMITLEHFETAVSTLRDYFGVVGIFGGNPAVHPKFEQICDILAANIPWERRGLWCNHPRGKIAKISETFNPAVSNINVHLVREAYDEFYNGWPAIRPYLKGLDPAWPEAEAMKRDMKNYNHRVGDARHSPPFVAMQDIDVLPFPDGTTRPNTEENRWELIAGCDINKHWSAIICEFRNELRGYFCEIAGSQAMLHQHDPNYPDLGHPIVPDWWRASMQAFAAQAAYHCHACGIPLRSQGELAVGGVREQVSQTHADVFKPKSPSRPVELVQLSTMLSGQSLSRVTDYVENGKQK